MLETYLYNGPWIVLEDFVLFRMPPSHDICFLVKESSGNSQTYILSLDPAVSRRLSGYFPLIRTQIDETISYKSWVILGNKNLLPQGLILE